MYLRRRCYRFDQYAIDPEAKLVSDFFVDDNPDDWIQA